LVAKTGVFAILITLYSGIMGVTLHFTGAK
jgi:hypothetical protein